MEGSTVDAPEQGDGIMKRSDDATRTSTVETSKVQGVSRQISLASIARAVVLDHRVSAPSLTKASDTIVAAAPATSGSILGFRVEALPVHT